MTNLTYVACHLCVIGDGHCRCTCTSRMQFQTTLALSECNSRQHLHFQTCTWETSGERAPRGELKSHLGAFCIDNAPILSVATTMTVLVATGLCPVAIGSRPLAIGSVRVATSSRQLQSDLFELQPVHVQLQSTPI